MVFARNISKIVRPMLWGRCLNPMNGTNSAAATAAAVMPIVSFSTYPQARQFLSTVNAAAPINDSTGRVVGTHLLNDNVVESRIPRPAIATEQLLESFHELIAHPSQGNIEQYTAIFKALADNREGERCFELLKELRGAGLKPNNEIYSHTIRAGRRALRAKEIREFFGTPLAKDQDFTNDGPTSAYQSIKEIMAMMTADECSLTTEFYDDLAFSLSGSTQGGLLINIASALEGRSIQPSTRFYNRMLHCLPKCGLSERADVLFSRMVFNNLADQDSYIYRISALTNTRRVKEAETVFTDMVKLYGLHEVACNIMIKGYLDSGNMQEAYRVFGMMQESTDPKVQPNNVTANTFIGYFHATGDVSAAQSILGYFFNKGFPQTMIDYANLFKLYARIDPIQANDLLKTLLKKDIKIDADFYNAMLQMVIDRKLDRTTRATLFKTMVPEPIPAKMDGLTELCVSTPVEFRQLLALMEREGVAPNSTTYELCMRALRRSMSWAAMANVYQRLMQSPVPIQNSHRNLYLDSLLQLNDRKNETLKAFINELVTRRHMIYDYNVRTAEQLGIQIPSAVANRPPPARPRDFEKSERRPRSFLETNLSDEH